MKMQMESRDELTGLVFGPLGADSRDALHMPAFAIKDSAECES
jgi:hypothetical protein